MHRPTAGTGGLEPPTPAFGTRCAIRLRHVPGRLSMFGAGAWRAVATADEVRTVQQRRAPFACDAHAYAPTGAFSAYAGGDVYAQGAADRRGAGSGASTRG